MKKEQKRERDKEKNLTLKRDKKEYDRVDIFDRQSS